MVAEHSTNHFPDIRKKFCSNTYVLCMCVCVQCIYNDTYILTWQLPIALPSPVHEFPSSLMASCCYKLLENPAVTRDRAVREKVFHLMGMVIKKYNQALSMFSTVQYTTVYHSKLHSTLQYTTVNCMHTTVYQSKFHGTLCTTQCA